jgi:hypothetical protein
MPQKVGADFVDGEKIVVVDSEDYVSRSYINAVRGSLRPYTENPNPIVSHSRVSRKRNSDQRFLRRSG